MTMINVHEAKARLSHYLALVRNGETVIICKRDVPIAELKPIQPKKKRPLECMKKKYQWSGDLSCAMDPLDPEDANAFDNSPLLPS